MKNYIRAGLAVAVVIVVLHLYYLFYQPPPTLHDDSEHAPEQPQQPQIIQGQTPPGHVEYSPDRVDLRIIVMTFNRAQSLARCLDSLNIGEYFGDRVHVDIWIDKPKGKGMVDEKTVSVATQFKFEHGTVTVHKRSEHAGLYGQWLTTWVPEENTKEIAIFIEDDLTLSKFFYKWLKLVHKKYDPLPFVNAFALQGKSIKHGGASGPLHGPDEEVVFSYPVLGSWGMSPSVKNWLSFLEWFKKASSDEKFVPKVPGSLTTKWYEAAVKQGKKDHIWTQWHIYHAYINKELTVYVNLPNNAGLSINWEEPGLHYGGRSKTVNKDPLLQVWDDKYADLPDLPVQLDINGKVVKAAERTAP